MHRDEIHRRIATLAAELQEMYDLISEGLPENAEGFPQPDNKDLADALRTINKAITVLSRLTPHIREQ